MKIKVGTDGYIEGFVIVGDMDGAEPYDGNVPEDFAENCRFYKLTDYALVFDADKKAQQTAVERIAELKSLLSATDYKAIKYAEGHISPEEYEPIKQQRQAWRDEINALEGEI